MSEQLPDYETIAGQARDLIHDGRIDTALRLMYRAGVNAATRAAPVPDSQPAPAAPTCLHCGQPIKRNTDVQTPELNWVHADDWFACQKGRGVTLAEPAPADEPAEPAPAAQKCKNCDKAIVQCEGAGPDWPQWAHVGAGITCAKPVGRPLDSVAEPAPAAPVDQPRVRICLYCDELTTYDGTMWIHANGILTCSADQYGRLAEPAPDAPKCRHCGKAIRRITIDDKAPYWAHVVDRLPWHMAEPADS